MGEGHQGSEPEGGLRIAILRAPEANIQIE
jgi:hypothetical protein